MKKISALIVVLFSVFCVYAVSVQELQSAAMMYDTSIRTASQDVDKALLDVKSARAGMLPDVDLTVTGSYLCNPIEPIKINLGDYVSSSSFFNGLGNDYITLYEGQEKTYYQFSLSLTQPVFTWGKIKNSIDLYNSVYDVRKIQYTDAVDKVFTEIETRCSVLYYLNQIRSLLDKQQAVSKRLTELAETAFDNGMMIESDFLNIKVQASKIDVAKAQVQQQIIQSEIKLKALTGIDVKAEDISFNESEITELTERICSAGYSELLSRATADNRSNFKMLNLLENISEITEKISSSSRNGIPDFAFVVSADYNGSRLPLVETDWYGKDDWDATLTLALKTTLFDGGKAKSNYLKSKADSVQAAVNKDSALAEITSSFTENFMNINVCKTNIEYQNSVNAQLLAEKAVCQNKIDLGYGSESELLEVELEINNSQIEAIQSKINLSTSVYVICYLTDFVR